MAGTGFEIKLMKEEDKERVLLFLRQYFFTDEPLNQYMEKKLGGIITDDRGRTTANSIKEGLSLMAVNPSGEIIGAVLNKLHKVEHEPVVLENNPFYENISKIMNKIEQDINELVKLKDETEKELNTRIISVHPDWRKKGVGLALLKATCELAKQNGFSQMRSVCTSIYSANALEKLGFKCVHAIKYEDFKDDGVIFKPGSQHTHLRAMVMRL